MEQAQAKFEGWAVLEMMGHRREIGFVTTEYFGGAALFRVDTPEIPEREIELTRPQYDDERMEYIPKGSKVKRVGIPAKTVFAAPGSLYAMTPCTEETARTAIEEMIPRKYIVLEIKSDKKALPGSIRADTFGQDICAECGRIADECECIEEGRNE